MKTRIEFNLSQIGEIGSTRSLAARSHAGNNSISGNGVKWYSAFSCEKTGYFLHK